MSLVLQNLLSNATDGQAEHCIIPDSPLIPPLPNHFSWFYVLRNVYGTKLSINIIRKGMLTYKFRSDTRLFVFFVVSPQLIERLSHCGTDISYEFSCGEVRDSS